MKKRSTIYLFLMALTLNACGAKPPEVLPATQRTAATAPPSAPEGKTYDRNGITLKLNTTFPETPAEMKVYLVKEEVPATVDSVRALAEQFKMNGEVYKLTAQTGISSGMLGSATEYLVVDGNRQLRVRSDKYFLYIPDTVSWTSMLAIANPPDAESAVREFMQAYGFNFEYRIEQTGIFNYAAFALSPDGFDVQNGNFQFDGLRFHFNRNGIAEADAGLLNYDETATMGVISAEEALQKYLDPNAIYGFIEGGSGGGFTMIGDKILKPEDYQKWTRVHPLDETLTYNGYLSATDRAVDGGAPFIMLDGYTVTGKTSGIPVNMQSTYIEARGQFHETDGVKTFEMESWKTHEGYEENIRGTLQREGDQFVLDDGTGNKYILQDVPADVPLPMDNAFVLGITRGDVFDWRVIDNGAGGGGGGGGGVSGFHKINFSGTPAPFPTPIPATPAPEPTLKTAEGLRGTLQVTLFAYPDGSQIASYLFLPYEGDSSDFPAGENQLRLKGNLDEALNAHHNRPVDIWGTITDDLEITVDRYEIPYPDLQFQLFKGTERIDRVDGQPARLITTDNGITYIALEPFGKPRKQAAGDPNIPVSDGGPVFSGKTTYEALIIPGESVSGYPGIRVFSVSPEMIDGTPIPPPSIINNQPETLPQSSPRTSMTIEKIELAYFAPDQCYPNGQTSDPVYVQPVWRFYGHYDNGDEFEILVQALKEEFLLPEVQGG